VISGGQSEPDRNTRYSHTDEGVSDHGKESPWSGSHMPRQNRIEPDRDAARQTNLTAVCMPAQHEATVGMRGPAGRFLVYGTRKHRIHRGYRGQGLFDVVSPIVVSIINAGEVDTRVRG
jgi:hypothetical protein